MTGAPLAIRSGPRVGGRHAATIGRWLVTRDGFDFLVFYLPDYDYASHISGPDAAMQALERADAAVGELVSAAGEPEAFLDRYAIVVCSDHGQMHVDRVATLQDFFADLAVFTGAPRRRVDVSDVVVTASNRSGMVYALDGRSARGCRASRRRGRGRPRALPRGWRGRSPGGEGSELRFAPDENGWAVSGDAGILVGDEYPNASSACGARSPARTPAR